jgi:DNA polymerase IIIc chi subunit
VAYRKKDREINIVHFSFFDLLFGAFGAFVFLMIMQIISTINLVDVDLQKMVDTVVKEKNELGKQVEQYKVMNQAFQNLKEQHKETLSKNQTLSQNNTSLSGQLESIKTEVESLKAFKEKADLSGDAIKALEAENRRLSTGLKKAGEKLALLKAFPLRIKTVSLPSIVADEKADIVLSAEGGTLPYTWDMSGDLPDGLSFDAEKGSLRGTPSTVGSTTFRVTVKDTAGISTESGDVILNVVQKQLPEKKRVSPMFMVMALIASMLLAYILREEYKARKHYKKMKAEGWDLEWHKKS